MPDNETPELPLGIDPVASRRIFFAMLALISGAALAYNLLSAPAGPPPKAIARDPLLVEGRTIYLARCQGCHGPLGRGDGAIARNLPGPPIGDLTDAEWKHGDRPEKVVAVIAQGAKQTAMPAWAGVLDDRQVRAVSAYVFYLAGRPVPQELGKP